MNIFTDVLFLFVFIITSLYFKIPDVSDNNYLLHKFYLFVGVFGFYYVIQMIKKIKNSCKVDPYMILQQGLNMALYCVIGYSVYVDLMHMDWSQDYIKSIDISNSNKKYLMISITIIIFVTLILLTGMLFKVERDDCINKI
jgi:hypothetical protein